MAQKRVCIEDGCWLKKSQGGSLRDFTIGLRLDGMDKIREFNSILDEENRNVITNNVWP
jgi:hypothetical protein